MKHLVSILLILIVGVFTLTSSIYAQDHSIRLSYREHDNLEMQGLLNVLNAHQLTTVIHAKETDARFYELWMVQSSNGVEKRTLFGFMPIRKDSTEICITAMALDSLSVRVSVSPVVSANRTIKMPTARCILMECTPGDNDTIPIMGYTPGVHVRFKIGEGKYADAFNYCAIRDAKLHPSQWHRQFNIEEYFYIEAIPVKEVDYQKASDVQ